MTQFPLKSAEVQIERDPVRPGAYYLVARLEPFLQMEQLTATVRLVTPLGVIR
jgi:type VI secretion system protein ImpC